MSTIITFELCGFRRSRGFLHGDPERAPIEVIRCGFFTLVRFKHQAPATSFSDFLKANVELDEYLAVRRPQVRQRIRLAEAKAKRQARAEVADTLNSYRDSENQMRQRCERYAAENFDLSVAVRALTKMLAKDGE